MASVHCVHMPSIYLDPVCLYTDTMNICSLHCRQFSFDSKFYTFSDEKMMTKVIVGNIRFPPPPRPLTWLLSRSTGCVTMMDFPPFSSRAINLPFYLFIFYFFEISLSRMHTRIDMIIIIHIVDI